MLWQPAIPAEQRVEELEKQDPARIDRYGMLTGRIELVILRLIGPTVTIVSCFGSTVIRRAVTPTDTRLTANPVRCLLLTVLDRRITPTLVLRAL